MVGGLSGGWCFSETILKDGRFLPQRWLHFRDNKQKGPSLYSLLSA